MANATTVCKIDIAGTLHIHTSCHADDNIHG